MVSPNHGMLRDRYGVESKYSFRATKHTPGNPIETYCTWNEMLIFHQNRPFFFQVSENAALFWIYSIDVLEFDHA